jgi:hypothetical protein
MNLSLSEARIHSLSASAAFLCPSLSLVFFCRRLISTVGKAVASLCFTPLFLCFVFCSPVFLCLNKKNKKKVSWQHLVVAATTTTTTTRLSQKRRGYLLFFHASFIIIIISRGAVGFGVWVAGEIDFSFLFSLSGVFYSGCI